MVEVIVVGGCEELNSLTVHVAVEAKKKSHKREITSRDLTFQFSVVDISKRLISSWLHPGVIAVQGLKDMVLVLVLELLKNLGNCTRREGWILNCDITNIHNLHRVWTDVRDSVSEYFISVFECFIFLIICEIFPVIRPALS